MAPMARMVCRSLTAAITFSSTGLYTALTTDAIHVSPIVATDETQKITQLPRKFGQHRLLPSMVGPEPQEGGRKRELAPLPEFRCPSLEELRRTSLARPRRKPRVDFVFGGNGPWQSVPRYARRRGENAGGSHHYFRETSARSGEREIYSPISKSIFDPRSRHCRQGGG